MINRYLLFLPVIVLFTSCIVQGLTDDYHRLNNEQKELIIELKSFQQLQSGYIYKITGEQLRMELKNYPKSLVYIFANGCSSELCKPLSSYEEFARLNGYQLFMIMNGFADIESTLKQSFNGVLYAIDGNAYNEKISYRYTRYFENELLGKPVKEKKRVYAGNLFFFQGNELVKVERELPKE
jgi:hypothetical protein